MISVFNISVKDYIEIILRGEKFVVLANDVEKLRLCHKDITLPLHY